MSNFLTGSDTPKEYCDKIYKEGDDYNGFNLITGTLWYVRISEHHARRK